jgi:hypothetical protein
MLCAQRAHYVNLYHAARYYKLLDPAKCENLMVHLFLAGDFDFLHCCVLPFLTPM